MAAPPLVLKEAALIVFSARLMRLRRQLSSRQENLPEEPFLKRHAHEDHHCKNEAASMNSPQALLIMLSSTGNRIQVYRDAA
jgi:hypothetical protein